MVVTPNKRFCTQTGGNKKDRRFVIVVALLAQLDLGDGPLPRLFS